MDPLDKRDPGKTFFLQKHPIDLAKGGAFREKRTRHAKREVVALSKEPRCCVSLASLLLLLLLLLLHTRM